MKIKPNYPAMIVFIVFLFCGSIFSQTNDNLLLDFQEKMLTERLQLNPDQVEVAKIIVKMLQSQETLDRQNFKENPQALIAAAMRRAQMAEIKLSNDLNNSQKITLNEIKESQKKDREFFTLKEGLILTEEQTVKIKAVLQIYATKLSPGGEEDPYDNMGDLAGPIGYGYGYGMDSLQGNQPGYQQGYQPGYPQGSYPNNRTGAMRDGTERAIGSNSMNRQERIIDKFKELEAEKENAIEQFLTPEQKKLFSQLKVIRQKELEKMIDKIKEEQGAEREF